MQLSDEKQVYIFYEISGNLTNQRLSVIMKAGKDTRLILKVLTVERRSMKNKLVMGALLLASSAVWAAPATTVAAKGIDQYELSGFIADFTHFKPGDTVPEMYRTDEYSIKQWKLRNLPAPDAGTHWTYMGGAYVLINDADGKIIKAYDGEIFYHR